MLTQNKKETSNEYTLTYSHSQVDYSKTNKPIKDYYILILSRSTTELREDALQKALKTFI